MAVKTRIAHPSVEERQARGQGGARPDASVQPHRMDAGHRPLRPGRSYLEQQDATVSLT